MEPADVVRVTVTEEAEGARLDRFLARYLRGHTRSALQRLIREGRVTVDGRSVPKSGLGLRSGMHVEVRLPAPPCPHPEPEPIPVEVVYEDDHFLVVDKPAGLVVHPGHGRRRGTLVNALLGRGTPLAPAGGIERPGIVHRLDRETSGLLLVAKTDPAYLALTRSLARREAVKDYVALVWGHPTPAAGTVDRGIGRSRRDRTRMSVGVPRARSAVTHYRTLETLPGFARLAVRIETGRTHQIRVHLQAAHHPVVGDARYGGRSWKGVLDPLKRKAVREFRRLALHATRLAVPHPVTGEPMTFNAPLPPEFEALLETLRATSR